MPHTMIPKDELLVFASLTDVKVVFDVGARDDVDYLILKPGIELHAFEPKKEWFDDLKKNVGDTKNVYLNNFAVGNDEGLFRYSPDTESIMYLIDEDHPIKTDHTIVIVKKLEKYIEEHAIKQIDFLKIDVEGYEREVIKGIGPYLTICRYIQYEQGKSSSKTDFDKLLPEDLFDLYYIGYRNVFAVRKGEILPWLPEETQEGGTPHKDPSNYLKTV